MEKQIAVDKYAVRIECFYALTMSRSYVYVLGYDEYNDAAEAYDKHVKDMGERFDSSKGWGRVSLVDPEYDKMIRDIRIESWTNIEGERKMPKGFLKERDSVRKEDSIVSQ